MTTASLPRILLSASIVWVACTAHAVGPWLPPIPEHPGLEEAWVLLPEGGEELAKGEDQRLISSTLAVLLGPFGAHRLYLGTTPRVAVIYGLTFGGFGVLALIDLGHLLFTKDLEAYRGSDRVFMWGEGGRGVTPP